jgi:hypothetical protein
MGLKLSGLAANLALPPRKVLNISFSYRMSRPQGSGEAERLRKIEKNSVTSSGI